MNEEELAALFEESMSSRFGSPPPDQIWIGDDAGIVAVPTGRLVISTDAFVEGVHADPAFSTAADMGWKAVMAAMSDVAAMGADPLGIVVATALGPDVDAAAIVSGMAEAASAAGCPVIGGDVSVAPTTVLTVTVLGSLPSGAPGLRRSGATAGDRLFVTGPLGASAAGLRELRDGRRDGPNVESHRRPRARLREGQVARSASAHAAIDISDGFSLDLARMADASAVGFELTRVPVAVGATEHEALGGGDDYELIIATADGGALIAAFSAAGLGEPMEVGVVVATAGWATLRGAPLGRKGWIHTV